MEQLLLHPIKTLIGVLTPVLTSALVLSGCATIHTPNVQPALLVHSDREVPQSIRDAVSDALNGREVTLGFDSLTKKSTLIVETTSRDIRRMGDRRIPKVDYFDLELAGDTCFLTHRSSRESYKITDVPCVLEDE